MHLVVQVNVQEAKARLSELIARAEHGEDVLVARAGTPVVRLVPVAASVRTFGMMHLPAVPDTFFEPLDEQELAAWE